MSVLDWVGVTTGIIAILSSLGIGIKKFNQYLVKEYLSELKLKLEILPLLSEIRADVAEMKGRLDQHLKEGRD